MPDSLNAPAPAPAVGMPPAAAAATPHAGLAVLAVAAGLLLASLLPAAAALIGWRLHGSTGSLAALHLSTQLRVTAESLEQQARAALRESPSGQPMPAWYAEELRRQAPAYGRIMDALAAQALPPGLTGEARVLRFEADAPARARIEAGAATWQDVRNRIEPALRPGSTDPALRQAAATLEALGPLVVEASSDLARALHAEQRDRLQSLGRAQWTLALALGLSAMLLATRTLMRARRAG